MNSSPARPPMEAVPVRGREVALILLGIMLVTASLVLLAACTVSAAHAATGPTSAPVAVTPGAVALGSATPGLDTSRTEALIPTMLCDKDRGYNFVAPRGLAVSRRYNEILVANTGSGSVDVFDSQGRARGTHVHQVRRADGTVIDGQPHWVAVDALGRTLVVDNYAAYVDVLDARGNSITHLDLGDSAGAVMAGPLTVLHDGTIAVGSRGNDGHIYFFSPSYAPAGAWGTPGTAPGQLSKITGIAETPDSQLVILGSDTQFAVQIFSRDGSFVRGFGKHDLGPGTFSFPSGVAITGDGRIWVSDEIRHQVSVFDVAGTFLNSVGSWGGAPGEFAYPSAVATDGGSYLVVSERVGARLQLFAIPK